MDLHIIVFLSGLITFVLNIIITPLLLYVANHFKWYDRIDQRKIHNDKIPRIGGVGIYLSFLAGLVIIYYVRKPLTTSETGFIALKQFLSFFLGLSVIHLLGLIDDFANLKAAVKFIVQLVVAGAIAFTGHTFRFIYIPLTKTVTILAGSHIHHSVDSRCMQCNELLTVLTTGWRISSIVFLTMGTVSILVRNISIASMSLHCWEAFWAFWHSTSQKQRSLWEIPAACFSYMQ